MIRVYIIFVPMLALYEALNCYDHMTCELNNMYEMKFVKQGREHV